MGDTFDAVAHPPSRPSLKERWRAQLQRWYASERLYRWSLSNPLTRRITRQRTQALFDIMAGFVHTQVLLACVRLDLFKLLRDQPLNPQELSERVQVPLSSLEPLLLSALSLGLLERREGERLGLGPLGVPVMQHRGIAMMAEHNQLLYQDLLDPVAFLRRDGVPQAPVASPRATAQGDMAAYWPYAQDPGARPAQQDPEQAERYSELMAQSQGFLVQEILRSFPLGSHRRLLDVGAGQGHFIAAVARHAPHLELHVFDLPPVMDRARRRLEAAGLMGRVQFHPGSFLDDDLPTGVDLVTLLRVLHDHPDEVVRLVLRKAWQALEPQGCLLIAEPMAQGPHPATGVRTDPYYHLYLLAMGRGRLRSAETLTAMLYEAGFGSVIPVPNALPIHGQLLLARKCLPSG